MRFSPAACSTTPIGLIATELELHALARRRERFSPADGAQPEVGVCARELDDARAPAPLPLRASAARNTRPSVAALPAPAGPHVS